MLTDYADPQPADEEGGYLIPLTMTDYVPRSGWLAYLVRLVLGSRWRWKFHWLSRWRWKFHWLMRLGWDEVQVNLYEMLLSKAGRNA
jgi:hypothetical protein